MARNAQRQQRAVVAAATRVRLDDRKLARKGVRKNDEWQDDSWIYFDLIGDLKQLVWLLGNLLAKLRLFVAVANPEDPDGEPIPVQDSKSGIPQEVADRATAELERLGRGPGGVGKILRLLNMNLEVAGEGYLIGRGEREEVRDDNGTVTQEAAPETWLVKSIKELVVKDQALPGGQGRKSYVSVRESPQDQRGTPLDDAYDTAIRFWAEHPAFTELPDSPVRGVLDDCELIAILKQQLRAEARSHLPAGFLFADSNLEWALPPVSDDGEEAPEGEGAEAAAQHPLLRQMAEVMLEATEDPSSIGALAPMLGLIPLSSGEKIAEKVMHLPIARTSESTVDERIKARVESLARGLNAPPEKVMGHQQTTFANAKSVDEDTWREHLQPRAILVVDVLTESFLIPQLTDNPEPETDAAGNVIALTPAGDPPEPIDAQYADQMFVWYDPSGLIQQPDPTENADTAHEKGTISDKSYRKAKGYGEDDAPEPDELLLRLAMKNGQLTPDMTWALLSILGAQLPAVEPIPTGQSQQDVAARIRKQLLSRATPATARTEPVLAAGAPRAPGRRLMAIDRDLRSRVLTLADRTMHRALERVANVARSKANGTAKRAVVDVPLSHVCQALGRAQVAAAGVDVDELLGEAFATMQGHFMQWGANAQRDALDVAARVAGFSNAQREALGLRQATDLQEAWGWLQDTLTTLAHERVFDPTATAERLGEFDESMSVPAGLVRQAISRAGGLTGLTTGGQGDSWVVLTDAGTAPAGGIGTGELLSGAMEDAGVSSDGFVWDYGPGARTRPFEPHEELDGVEFANFDDDALANLDEWPPLPYFMPGDHDGCLCDFVPIIDASARFGSRSHGATARTIRPHGTTTVANP